MAIHPQQKRDRIFEPTTVTRFQSNAGIALTLDKIDACVFEPVDLKMQPQRPAVIGVTLDEDALGVDHVPEYENPENLGAWLKGYYAGKRAAR
ncbi:hypothetical protein [Corynebacterium fournieri]|uniref:hypothetical protein n=1 Tax=Corynebacterium fournieri TaxID=1852390 RepID=UPI000A2F4317|nr:hypothetical protein [Corynebacterium fournieri]WJY97191.1 hypothetical protein CFOUR_03820 [Corynebacterium fournieri]